MSIYLESKTDLAAMFSAAAGVTVTVNDLVFGTPKTPSSAEKTQFNRNTKIGLAFKPSSTVGVGTTKFFYDRLDVAALALMNFRGSAVTAGQNLAAVLPILRNYTGAWFTTDDLVEHSTVDDGNGNITFFVEAKPTSVGWTGSVTLTLAQATGMNTEFADDKLDGFN